MKKSLPAITLVFAVLLLSSDPAAAITAQEISEAKALIDSKAECRNLSDDQLELIGEYYMNQMHAGEVHELMHRMMGLQEGSEAEKLFHANMAKTMYCGEHETGYGMDVMGGMMGYGGMMPMMGMMQPGMMGQAALQAGAPWTAPWYASWYWGLVNALYVLLLAGLVILVYLGIIKLCKDIKSKKR